MRISIDIETYSSVDLAKSGVYKYAMSDDFEILLLAYAWEGEPVEVVDLARGEAIPEEVLEALAAPNVTKQAYNAVFEWWCLTMAGYKSYLEDWECTMVHSLYLGYSAGLANTGLALGLGEEAVKSKEGRALIRYFCTPCKPTKANGGRTRNLPHHDEEKWEAFKEYNRQDVVAEMAIYKKLTSHPMPESEWKLWKLDTAINIKGIQVDNELIDSAVALDEMASQELVEEGQKITGLENPNSPKQIMEYAESKGVAMADCTKATVAKLLEDESLPPDVRRLLEIRQELGKTSVSKYLAMQEAECFDGRVRGLLQFYGANRTGRWAGRLVQVQNLPRNDLQTLGLARDLVKARRKQDIEIMYGSVQDTLKQLIRTAFIPSKDKLIISDFSSIEARILAWLADERWKIEAFARGEDIYCSTASQMFNVPVVRHGENGELRDIGKVAELACGYGGGLGALKAMGGERMGLDEGEMEDIKTKWRSANRAIVRLWADMETMGLSVVNTGRAMRYKGLITMYMTGNSQEETNYFAIRLPSGRSLYYCNPSLRANKFGRMAIHYQEQQYGKWQTSSTFGGKLVENIVQAMARDCLATSLVRIKEEFPEADIIMHVHDEVVLDAPDSLSVDEVNAVMARPIDWAGGLELRADGFESEYYMKD